jgi:predicted ferric reductase
MRKLAFFIAYALTPSIPASLYMRSIGASGLDSYTASVMLGAAAYIMVCNQFILASRPSWAIKALGLKGLLAFHGAMPILILAAAGAHRLLKAEVGFDLRAPQATLGAVAWWVFLAAAVFALLFLAAPAGPLAAKVRDLRKWAQESFRLSHKLSRAFHNVTVAAGIAVAVHALLASSSDLSLNPAGAAWMASWLLLSLGLYARYRIRGRKSQAA